MGVLDFAVHLLNFAAPAVFTALLVALAAAAVRLYARKTAFSHVLYKEFAINFIVCVFLLLAGLVFFGRDGTIAGYTAMVLGCATSQWWMLRKI
jgi:hypothetical protein